MSKYLVGVLKHTNDSAFDDFLYQANNMTVESDENVVQDENGNVVEVQKYNHRVRMSLEAVIKKDAGIPVPGQTVTIKKVVLPTVSADGTVSGNFKLDNTADTPLDFMVDGTPSVTENNTEATRCTFEVIRYLVNGVPSSSSSSSSASA